MVIGPRTWPAWSSTTVTLLSVTLPVLVTVPEKLMGAPGAVASAHTLVTAMLGSVLMTQVALAVSVTGAPALMASVPDAVTVFVDGVPAGM